MSIAALVVESRQMIIPAVLLSFALWTAADAPKPQIERLALSLERATPQSSLVELDFALAGGFGDELRERIESGLPTSIVYEMELVRERRGWLDRTLARSTLEVSASYDAMTREYHIHHRLDDDLIDSQVAHDFAELERAMTELRDVPAFELARPLGRRPMRARVRADLGSRTWLSLIPVRIATDWAVSRRIRPSR